MKLFVLALYKPIEGVVQAFQLQTLLIKDAISTACALVGCMLFLRCSFGQV